MRLVAPARERVVTNRRRVWISGIGGPVYAGPGYRCVVRTGRATSLRRCAACRHMPFVTRAALLQLALSPAARLLGLTAMAGTGAAAAERGDEPQRPVRWKGAVKLAPATSARRDRFGSNFPVRRKGGKVWSRRLGDEQLRTLFQLRAAHRRCGCSASNGPSVLNLDLCCDPTSYRLRRPLPDLAAVFSKKSVIKNKPSEGRGRPEGDQERDCGGQCARSAFCLRVGRPHP